MSKKRSAYRFGVVAEYLAALSLALKGYRILKIRYRNPKGEIDILALKGDVLVAVEVKARKRLSECEISITHIKRKHISSALEWLMLHPSKIAGLRKCKAPNIRFDAVWVVPFAWPKHVKDAWRM